VSVGATPTFGIPASHDDTGPLSCCVSRRPALSRRLMITPSSSRGGSASIWVTVNVNDQPLVTSEPPDRSLDYSGRFGASVRVCTTIALCGRWSGAANTGARPSQPAMRTQGWSGHTSCGPPRSSVVKLATCDLGGLPGGDHFAADLLRVNADGGEKVRKLSSCQLRFTPVDGLVPSNLGRTEHHEHPQCL
jgi:hypothetical protein